MKFEIVDKKRCGEFINIFSNLKHFTDSISLMISEEKLYIQGMDQSHVCVYELFLDNSWRTKLQTLTNIPKKKYPYPMTAAQEVGWEADNLFDTHKPKYAFNRQMYQETTYVNNYVTTMHVNPLIKAKAVPLEKK